MIPTRSKTLWAFVLLAAIWGSTFLFIALGLKEASPMVLVSLRTAFAALALAGILLLMRPAVTWDRRTVGHLLVVGVLNPAIPYVLITWGQQVVSSSLAGIINATVPLFTLPMAHLLLRDEEFNRTRIAGLLIGFLGVVLIFARDLTLDPGQSQPATGLGSGPFLRQAAMVAAAACYAASMVYVRRFLRTTPPEVVAGTSQGLAFVLTALAALAFEPLAVEISLSGWAVIAWLGVSSGVSYILFYYVLGQWGTTRTSLVTYLVPVIAVILGALVLDEIVTRQALLGGAMVLSGIVIINRDATSGGTEG